MTIDILVRDTDSDETLVYVFILILFWLIYKCTM